MKTSTIAIKIHNCEALASLTPSKQAEEMSYRFWACMEELDTMMPKGAEWYLGELCREYGQMQLEAERDEMAATQKAARARKRK